MSADKLSITVLMTVYNDAAYLRQSVNCILHQTFSDFEFLIIDDGSTDNSAEIVRSFKDPRIVYKKIKHSGLAAALNYGMKIAAGDWIARSDADDLSVTSRLEIQTDHLLKHPETDVLGSWSVYFSDPSQILFRINPPTEDKKIKEFMELHNPINHSSVIFRKDKILLAGGYDEDFGVYEDFELWLRMKNKLSFNIIPESLVYTRYRKNSMTSLGSREKIHSLLVKNLLTKSDSDKLFKPGKKDLNIDLSENIKMKLFWIEYFYGSKTRSRDLLKDTNKFSTKDIRKSLAFYNSYLPEKYFNRVRDMRLRQRIESFKLNKKFFKQELINLQNLK